MQKGTFCKALNARQIRKGPSMTVCHAASGSTRRADADTRKTLKSKKI